MQLDHECAKHEAICSLSNRFVTSCLRGSTLDMPTTTEPIWTRKHLLGLEELSADEIRFVLDTADSFKEVSTRSIKKVPALRGRVVVNAFFEDSTRTRTSFSLAAQRLSADLIDFSEKGSSVSKGETLIDTARNIEAMGIDVIVVRHPAAGAAHVLARTVKCSIVNAGDGAHEHPTQGLLDLYTIRERFGRIEGLKVAIVGDIANSRVARSNLWALTKLGAEVILVGPPTLVPRSFEQLGARVVHDFDEVIGEVDVINMLRVQFERIASSQFPSVREFTRLFGLTSDRFQRCKKDVFVMHPGPMNRGIEISSAHRRRPAERNPDAGDQRPGGADGGALSGDAGAIEQKEIEPQMNTDEHRLRTQLRYIVFICVHLCLSVVYSYFCISEYECPHSSSKTARSSILRRSFSERGICSSATARSPSPDGSRTRSGHRRHRLLRHAGPDRHSRSLPRARRRGRRDDRLRRRRGGGGGIHDRLLHAQHQAGAG